MASTGRTGRKGSVKREGENVPAFQEKRTRLHTCYFYCNSNQKLPARRQPARSHPSRIRQRGPVHPGLQAQSSPRSGFRSPSLSAVLSAPSVVFGSFPPDRSKFDDDGVTAHVTSLLLCSPPPPASQSQHNLPNKSNIKSPLHILCAYLPIRHRIALPTAPALSLTYPITLCCHISSSLQHLLLHQFSLRFLIYGDRLMKPLPHHVQMSPQLNISFSA